MNNNKRRAIVWENIERLAFRPTSHKDRRAWLGVYARTLHQFWGMGYIHILTPLLPDNGGFLVTFQNLKCSYLIESALKYSISFEHDSSDCLHWQTHVDPEYHSKASLQTSVDNYPSQEMSKLHHDVKTVLDGMLFHPRCHAHLEDLGVRHVQLDKDSGGLSSHEVRIGGGIENPYVFLFHLRYQFCLVSNQARIEEKKRLIFLFKNAIQERFTKVNTRELFNFRA